MTSSPEQSPQLSNPAVSDPTSTVEESPTASDISQGTPAVGASDSASEDDVSTAVSEPTPPLKRPVMRPVRPEPPAAQPAQPSATIQKPAAPSKPVAQSASLPSKETVLPQNPSASVVSPPDSEDAQTISRQRPIPPPSEPKQYRAIGLVRGCYKPSEEQFTRGEMTIADGTVVEAVLLGRIMSLVKNHLDLEQQHLWVVYPRTRDTKEDLHVQIVGVWEPEKLHKEDSASEAESSETEISGVESSETEAEPLAEGVDVKAAKSQSEEFSPGFDDDYFSIRGEVVFYDPDAENVIVKIQQSPKKNSDKAKVFKLHLTGVLKSEKVVGYFWDFQVNRQAASLVIMAGTAIGLVPPKKKTGEERQGDRRPFKKRFDGGGRSGPPSRGPRPSGVSSTGGGARREALPKPSKRSDQSKES